MQSGNNDLEEKFFQREYSVTELSNIVKVKLEHDFSNIKVKGEVSGLKIAPSGHIYFSLKDSQAVLAAICWRGAASKLSLKLQEGLEIICQGSITSYAMQSKYQLIIEHFEIAGSGALMALLLKRKEQFLKEGLFDASRKKSLPLLPKIIGIVTSPTGAVIRDILHRINDRMPMHVMIWPTLVQGEQAANQIAEAIIGFNELFQPPDVIIVARGGGSIEDLWAFNEEVVIRAAAASKIPLISAIGHETDTTLIDYASDLRAPTPTAAAELAVPVRANLLLMLSDYERRLAHLILQSINHKINYFRAISNALPKSHNLLLNLVQKLDYIVMRFELSIENLLLNKESQLKILAAKIITPLQIMANNQKRLEYSSIVLINAMNNLLKNKQSQLNHAAKLLESYDYKKVLNRGFAILREAGQVINSVNDLKPSSFYQLELKDGITEILVHKFLK